MNEKNKATDTHVIELEKVLCEELSLYQKYAEALSADTERMVGFKINELEASNKVKATLLLKIQSVEELRQRVIRKIAETKGINPDGVRITDICKDLKSEESARLMKLRTQFHEIVYSIRRTQDATFTIAQSSIRWIDGSMAQLRNLLNPRGTYNARGRVDHPGAYAGRVVESKV